MTSSPRPILERRWLQALAQARAAGTLPPLAPRQPAPTDVAERLALMVELSIPLGEGDARLLRPQRIRGSNFRM